MIQTYLVSDYPEWEAIVEVGADVAGVDLLIGEEDLIGRGLGPQVLARFAREVVTASAVVATVEEENRRSWRAFEKAGFRHVRDVQEDGKPKPADEARPLADDLPEPPVVVQRLEVVIGPRALGQFGPVVERRPEVVERGIGVPELRLGARQVVEQRSLVLVLREPVEQQLLRLGELPRVEHREDLDVRLPCPRPIGGTRTRPDDQRCRPGLGRHGAALRSRIADEDERSRGRIDLVAVDREGRPPGDDEVQLLVARRHLVVL